MAGVTWGGIPRFKEAAMMYCHENVYVLEEVLGTPVWHYTRPEAPWS
jgi:hypothetical protein